MVLLELLVSCMNNAYLFWIVCIVFVLTLMFSRPVSIGSKHYFIYLFGILVYLLQLKRKEKESFEIEKKM